MDGQRCESSPVGRDDRHHWRGYIDREERSHRISMEKGEDYIERTSEERDGRSYSSIQRSEQYHKRKSAMKDDVSPRDGYRHNDAKHSHKRHKSRRSDRRSCESEDRQWE